MATHPLMFNGLTYPVVYEPFTEETLTVEVGEVAQMEPVELELTAHGELVETKQHDSFESVSKLLSPDLTEELTKNAKEALEAPIKGLDKLFPSDREFPENQMHLEFD